jgi:hypothetical protein
MRFLICCLALVVTLPVFAQQSKQIETDRPGETQSPSVVPRKKFQAEIAVEKEAHDHEYRVFHPDALLKYGLFEKFELRVQFKGETQKFSGIKDALTGLNPVEFGFKLSIAEGKGATPDISLLSQFGIPKLSSGDFNIPNVLPKLRLLLQNKLSEKTKLGYNLGVEWDEPEQPPMWLYTISPQFDLTDHWHFYLEAYGKFRKESKPEEVLDASIAWLPNDHMQIDLNGGTGISSEAPKYFVSVGFSVRL